RADQVAHLAGWNAAALLITGMAALAATVRGAREATTEVDRQVRLTLGGAAFFYAFGQMAHLVARVSGQRLSPVFDAIPIIGIVIGVIPIVLGSAWEALAGSTIWAPYTIVQGGGILIAGFGCATWTAELDPSLRFRQMAARVRGWLPLAAVAVSSALIVANQL